MIKTKLLEPEVFTNVLKKTGEILIEERKEKVERAKGGLFGGTIVEFKMVEHEIPVLDFDEDLLKTFPKDVQEQIRKEGVDDKRGYTYFGGLGWNCSVYYNNSRSFTRSFDNTLNDFNRKNKVTKKNLISLEYCKKECDNACTITGAYISWDDGT